MATYNSALFLKILAIFLPNSPNPIITVWFSNKAESTANSILFSSFFASLSAMKVSFFLK